MHIPLALGLLALTHSAFAQVQYNASTITNSAQFSSAAAAIAASYFPSSIIPSLAVAIGSASASGEPRAIISELMTASAPPPYLSALPTPYQSRLMGAESRISSLRAAIDSITVASISSLIGNATRAGNITLAAVTATASNGSTFATTVPAVLVNGTTITSGVTPVPTEASNTASGPASTAPGGTDSSSGFAVPTHVPVAAAGLIGALGLLIAL